ncbi:MAG: TrlF family AAA-like ATPase [Gimesia chilikensis]|uniref:TrlF family AAA-like ATPase n=1 Tax=Gimesia chilikensis TaxID=2605989 RepID=UPI00378B1EF3
MDKGAHFKRCDFQVHSPRDLNWDGERPVTEEERKEYAKQFISACREKGLDAVAITDHHDLGFYSFIREAAELERDSEGEPVEPSRRIVVFPGMELTLGLGCQALLIVDANFPLEFLPQIATALSVTCNDPNEPTHVPTQRLDHFKDFEALHERLDQLSFLKGHFIILPNISKKGASTLQRKGFSAHYRSMPCVGGYLDHAVENLGIGDRNILEGRVEEYNFKPLGIFPTSDNRHRDFRLLGQNSAWVKWSEPTAEALRQACLARSTRILHSAPQLPTIIIESLHVSLSKFLGPIDLSFNPQFNCLIGGRGTGKSTILEYLRWGVCDQPFITGEEGELPDFQTKRNTLIENTLKPHKAVVRVHFSVNGVPHVVRRKTETGEVLLKVGNEPEKAVREKDVRELLPLHAYSQKQLSAVGVRSEELLRFIESPVARKLNELSSLCSDSVARIRSSYAQVQRKKGLANEIARQKVELVSVEKQLTELQKGLKGLSADDQAVLATHKQFLVEQESLKRWERNTEKFSQVISETRSELSALPSSYASDETMPNNALLVEAHSRLSSIFSVARKRLEEVEGLLSESSEDWRRYSECKREWETKYEAHEKRYEDVKKRATEHEALLKQITELEERIKSLKETIAQRNSDLEEHGSPEVEYTEAQAQWVNLFQQKAEILDERCREMTQLSGAMILASLQRGSGVEGVMNKLLSILERTGIRGQAKKLEDLCATIRESDDSIEQWQKVLSDLEALSNVDFEAASIPELPATPTLTAAGFTQQDIEKVARRLTPESWIDLSLIELEDVPSFQYRLREGEYVPFAEASAGQQATALLRVLLNQQGPPLVIDQPEDDLDNQVVLKVVEEIWSAKKNRQIIFSSHNANVVVNGDADLVVCCDYRTEGDQSGGKIKLEGAIDIPEIRNEITTVMEGGKTAFLMRQDKYGF